MVQEGRSNASPAQQQPQPGPRLGLPTLRPAAAAALDVEPSELIARWLDALSPTARRSYRRSLARFAAWSLANDAAPEAALRLLCSLDVGRAGELVRRWRDELLASGLSSGSVCGYCEGFTSCQNPGTQFYDGFVGCFPPQTLCSEGMWQCSM